MQIITQAFNSGEITADTDLSQVFTWMTSNAPENLSFLQEVRTQVPQGADQLQSPVVEEQKAADKVAAQSTLDASALQTATDPASPGGAGITEEEKKAAEEAGATEDSLPTNAEPRWILEKYGPLTISQKNRILQDVQLFYGQHFPTFEQLAESGFLDDATSEIQGFVESSVYDTKLEQGWQFDLPSGDLFTVKAEDWANANKTYGVAEQTLTSLIKMADQLNVKDGAGKLNWQPFIALMQSTGLLDDLTPQESRRVVRGQEVITRTQPSPDDAIFNRPLDPNINQNILRGEGLRVDTKLSARELATAFNEGLQRYGDQAMAYIFAQDPALAGRIDAAGGDLGKIRAMDLQTIASLGSKFTDEPWWASSGVTFIQNFLQLDAARAQAKQEGKSSGGGGVKSETVRQKPDPATLNETMRQLYQQMFLEEPDEATLANFRAQIDGAVGAMQPGDSVDVSARAREFARNDPRYGQLYGHKPDHVSEEDYQGQFRAAQASMLGNEVGTNDAILAGMRGGQYQTSVGAAAGTKEAWDNSTFLGRLARAGQVVGEMT